MKAPGIITTAVLSLLLGAVAPALAGQDRPADQQDHAGQNTREQDQRRVQDHRQKPSADRQQQQADQQQRDRHTYEQSRPDDQSRQAQRQEDRQQQQTRQAQRPRPEQQREARDSQNRQGQQQRANRGYGRGYDRDQARQSDRHSAWEQHRAEDWQSDHRTWQQRGGYNGYRVPQSRYRGYFGPQHGFRIAGLPFMSVGGYPRFQYSGYWISLVDPWPGEWANGWYDNDDVYIDYVDNGYYLFNRQYPGIGIAISISQ